MYPELNRMIDGMNLPSSIDGVIRVLREWIPSNFRLINSDVIRFTNDTRVIEVKGMPSNSKPNSHRLACMR